MIDFPNVDMTAVQDNSAYIKIITKSDVLTCDLAVLPDNECPKSYESYYNGYLQVKTVNGYAPYDNIEFYMDMSDGNGTNYTDGEVQLVDLGSKEVVASKQLSELERVDGALYTYSGSFNNAEIGSRYELRYYNEQRDYINGWSPIIYSSSKFYAADKPTIHTDVFEYGGGYLGSARLTGIAQSINIDYDSDSITACLEDGTEIPVTAERANPELYQEKAAHGEYGSFAFDFSQVPAFSQHILYVFVNGEEAGSFSVRDYRDKSAVTYSAVGVYDNQPVIRLRGVNLDKCNLSVKVWSIDEYNFNEVSAPEPVIETSMNPDSDESYNFPLNSLNLSDGRYVYQIYVNGAGVVNHDNFKFRAGSVPDSDMQVVVIGKTVSGSEMSVELANMSADDITADVIAAAYDESGALLDMHSESVTIQANSVLNDIVIPTIPGAAEYKVFVWDSIDSMIPLTK